MKMFFVTAFHVKDDERYTRRFYYQTNAPDDEALACELQTCFRNLGIADGLECYVVTPTAPVPFTSATLQLI